MVRFGNEQTRFTTEHPPAQLYEQQFAKYATLSNQPPTYQALQFETTNNYKTQLPNHYEQQFHKYSTLNPNLPSTAITTPNLHLNSVTTHNNVINYQTSTNIPNLNFNKNGYAQQAFVQPTFTTSNYAPVGFNSQFSRPISVVQATSQVVAPVSGGILPPSNDNSSDFLRKIDEQLESSRRQFPT